MVVSLSDALAKIPFHQTVGMFLSGGKPLSPSAAPFIQSGLAQGEKCLLACGPALADAILSDLRALGVDVANSLQRGTVVAIRRPDAPGGAAGTNPLDFLPEMFRMSVSERYSALRVVLETASLLGAEPTREEVASLLDGISAFVAGHRAVVLCIHDLERFPPDALPLLLRAHPQLLHGARLLENFYHVREGGTGKADAAKRELLESLDRLVVHADRLGKIRRQAIRLERFRDLTLSLMRHTNTADLLAGIADSVVSLGHRLCWVGMARPDGRVEPVAVAGDRSGYLRSIAVRWDDTPEGRGPVGSAIRKGEAQIIQDVVRSRRFAPWRAAAIARSFQSVAAIPIRVDGNVVGSLAAYSADPRAFDREALDELSAFALQASLALQRGREHRRLARSEDRLRRIFEQIPAACFTFDRSGHLIDWNLHCRRLFGQTRDVEPGMSVFRFLATPEGVAQAQSVIGQLFEGKSFSNLEWDVETGQGVRRLLTTVYPYRGATDQVEMGIGVGVERNGPSPEGGRPGKREKPEKG